MVVLIDGKEVNTYDDLSLICPYCGHSEFVSCDTFDEQTLDDTEQEFVCPKCKKSFIGERILNISYETYKCDERGKKIDEDAAMHDNCWYDDEQMIEDFQKAMEE